MSLAAQEQTQSSVHLENRHVVFTYQAAAIARISVDEIKLIGEYTTGDGPLLDDWFIVFMTSPTDWKQISEYTPGMQEMLQAMGQLLDAPVVCSLFGSTSWKTSIIWPPSVAEMEMWNVQTNPPVTLWQKLKDTLGMGSNQTLVLTQAASSVFA
jgi:hypothetical protein